MKSNIIITENFRRESKKLLKKYASLKGELIELEETLLENPKTGVLIKENIYKVRLAVKSKGKGKSGGLRVINYVIKVDINDEEEITIFLMSIYDKSIQENISDNRLKSLVNEVTDEFLDGSNQEEE
ncbi:MAG: hypothetical protein COZ18_13795 [Flexibacter sp. CG_4_10_14_3_um_filter_32_15]|nr:MAG: hypothetical protein COZ18_13795 [Flexibacter sp. CG_4_10_14_3_um_filter_32_15]